MNHRMKLQPAPFEKIQAGTKTIELRLNDAKRQKVQVGDIITFTAVEDRDAKIRTRVTALHHFPGFEEMFRSLPMEACGYPDDCSVEEAIAGMRQYYSEEAERENGVLGIVIEVLAKEKEDGVKFRLFYLYQLLMRESDAEHPITTNQLIRLLKERYDIKVNRNTITNDLVIMRNAGLHVEVKHSTQNRYYFDGDIFEVPELKMLMDAVSSAKFITQHASEELIGKLLTLTNIHNSDKLRRHISVQGRVKSENEKGYYIADAINDAIDRGRRISFRYMDYDASGNLVLRRDGEAYIFSPYALIWDGDFYYAVGFCESRGCMRNFRLDRIAEQPEILDEAATPAPEGFDVAEYTRSSFRMFDGGEPVEITLLCTNGMMKYLVDHFGTSVDTEKVDEEHLRARVWVGPSPTFYRWVFGMDGGVKIEGPEEVRAEYRAMLERAMAGV